MREKILIASGYTSAFVINADSPMPYGTNLKRIVDNNGDLQHMKSVLNQQGLAIKTYQSDIFNNWISTEWIDGTNGINEITSVSTVGDKFTIDSLNLANKVYNMLNRIGVSGGSYNDWITAVYDQEPYGTSETPIYCGGLSKEIVFNEVVSNASAEPNSTWQPLGTLAGKGALAQKHKGGKLHIKTNEPAYCIGIVSITPRIDYSQGNEWDTSLKTMNDLHKPDLDGIGFQDLVTSQMYAGESFGANDASEKISSAGKTVAWINYMTAYNKCYGNFAMADNQMFMTLNRRYEVDKITGKIKDLTTYIDPTKFNYAFAQTDIQAQNFWVQIAVDNTARRKMSAKQIPNL